MNQKAFTLVEVLAVIVILGLIVTIVYPTVVSTVNNSKNKTYNSQLEIIKKAARVYALDKEEAHDSILPELTEGQSNTFPITELIEEGYIASEELKEKDSALKNDGTGYYLENPTNNEKCKAIKITYESNQYTYTLITEEINGTECSKAS